MHEILGDQLVIAMIGSWLIELLKKSRFFPLITVETEKLNKLFSALVAALATAGILLSATWDPSVHTFTLTIANLTVASVVGFLYHWVSQYVFLKAAYKFGIKNNKTLPPSP